ncbi:MAG: DUF554 domain-containing protein [Prevotella sp.]|jgi:uncharacterized membrane protein YqgA involved in biofilm formation|nr:DUF554 domain-containing protein [Prevotella sp.]
MTGTFVNTGAVIVGSVAGLLIHSRLPKRLVDIVFQGIGLFTVTIGISMSLKSDNMLLLVVSIVLGAIIGQAIDLDKYLRHFSGYLQRKYAKSDAVATESNRFTEGFITASMLFCVGSMSILGAIEDGMGKTPDLLYTKSLMDGISSIALSSSFGVCIAFSSIPLFLYQGGLTLFAGFIMQYMSEPMRNDMTAVGGILLIGLGINILKIKEISIINMLPSLIIVVILSWMWG